MHFEQEPFLSTNSQDFDRRLKVQAELQTQELVQLLKRRIWEREDMYKRQPMPLLQRIQTWMARHLQLRTPVETLGVYMPPTEHAVQVIEVEYKVQEVEVPTSDDWAVTKEGMP